jgi:hypothetical protein
MNTHGEGGGRDLRRWSACRLFLSKGYWQRYQKMDILVGIREAIKNSQGVLE